MCSPGKSKPVTPLASECDKPLLVCGGAGAERFTGQDEMLGDKLQIGKTPPLCTGKNRAVKLLEESEIVLQFLFGVKRMVATAEMAVIEKFDAVSGKYGQQSFPTPVATFPDTAVVGLDCLEIKSLADYSP